MFSDGPLHDWLSGVDGPELRVGRLPRSVWPVLVAATGRAAADRARSVLVLTPGPSRFLGDLRPWLGGRPQAHVFAEVTVSFLDRPPAFDEAVALRLEALAALQNAADEPCMVVSSRRAMMRMTIAAEDLAATTLALRPGLRAEPVELAARLVE